MRSGWAAMMAATLVLPGCASRSMPDRPVAIESEWIRYETSPCFGTCPVYVVQVRPDGSGTFTGIRHTAAIGERRFALDAGSYRRFAAALAPWRPEGEQLYQPGTPLCGLAATDGPGVDVRWSDQSGGGAHLSLYYGCEGGRTGGLHKALSAAPGLLPIAALIGAR